ncbi:MAG: exosome subunit [Archaeoglobaceae archaeon]|nr:exosome subunit [Archaeoglobaceae archaeon]
MGKKPKERSKAKIEHITVSAVVYSTEDREKVGEAIATLFPFEFEILRSKAKGHYGNPLEFLEVEIKKKREIKEFWENLVNLLKDQKEIILNTLEDRLDEQNVLHLRIDKQKAYLGKVELIDGGDAIVVKVKVVTYPAKREKVIEALKGMFDHV